MKTYERFLVQCAISFLMPPILFTGCSLIGFTVGAISDSGKKGGGEISGIAELRHLQEGTGIVLITRDGTRIDGDFLAIHQLNRQEYDRLYLAAIETLEVRDRLPLPGDTLTFEYFEAPGKKMRGLFRGVDPGLLLLWQRAQQFSMTGVRNLRGDSARPLDLFALHALSQDGRLPHISTGVLVDRGKDTTEVPVEEIVRIEKDAGGNGKLTGFVVGAVIDAVVLIVISAQEHEREESCNRAASNNSSCNSNRVQG
jgi:hypothetical protein